jgi:hypothetical protein
MKSSTKFLAGAGAALAGVWAWMRYGKKARRTPLPGYVSATNVFDANRRPGIAYVYPPRDVNGQRITATFFVPVDETQSGVWSYATLNRVAL